MKMDDEARTRLDETVDRILARHHLPEAERAGARYELKSHLHSAAQAKAEEAGRDAISAGDLEAAVLDAGGEQELAEAFVQPMARPPDRAGFVERTVAFLVDGLLIAVAAALVWMVLFYLWILTGTFPAGPFGPMMHDGWTGAGFPFPVFPLLFPFGIAGLLTLVYFVSLEGARGTTIGKQVLDLRVVTEDGDRIGYGDALLRNLAKIALPLLVLDALLGFLVDPDDKQRLSDRLADTIVVEG